MSKFQVGDKVRLSEMGCENYTSTSSNPHDLTGVVVETIQLRGKTTRSCIYVKWSNNTTNNYRELDLEHVSRSEQFKRFKSIVKGDLVYYYSSDDHREKVLKDFTDDNAMRTASIVLCKRTNSVLKMRYDLKTLFDELLE